MASACYNDGKDDTDNNRVEALEAGWIADDELTKSVFGDLNESGAGLQATLRMAKMNMSVLSLAQTVLRISLRMDFRLQALYRNILL